MEENDLARKIADLLLIAVLVIGVGLVPYVKGPIVEAKMSEKGGHWIGAWSASQAAAWDSGITHEGFNNQTIRMIIHPNASGSSVKIRLSNEFGTKPLTFDKVTIANKKAGAEVVAGSVKNLTFNHHNEVTIPKGEAVYSDPIPFIVKDGTDLTISIYLQGDSGPVTWHNTSSQTTYISAEGDFSEQVSGDSYTETFNSWFFLAGVDVLTDSNKKSRVIVALGDSITDGYLSTINENRRWTDVLNDRLDREIKNQHFSVLNSGITGNRILTDSPIYGEKALSRLNRDVFSQTGVTDIILLEGINDIGHIPHVFDAQKIIAGMKEMAKQAHKRGLKIYIGTLTPFYAFKPGNYYTEEGERTRQEVNKWIRSNDVFDGVIDFDRTLADPEDPKKLLEEFDSGDNLHPNDLGLRAMAESIDLSIFEKPLKRGKTD